MKSEEECKKELRNWVLKVSSKITAEELTDETGLIDTRIISSMQVMELVLFLEKLKGSRLNMKSMRPGVFKNINSIYDTFLRTV